MNTKLKKVLWIPNFAKTTVSDRFGSKLHLSEVKKSCAWGTRIFRATDNTFAEGLKIHNRSSEYKWLWKTDWLIFLIMLFHCRDQTRGPNRQLNFFLTSRKVFFSAWSCWLIFVLFLPISSFLLFLHPLSWALTLTAVSTSSYGGN